MLVGLHDHFHADDRQQDERHPVVVGLNELFHIDAGEEARDGHEELEGAKSERHPETLTPRHPGHLQTGDDAHGKGIHRETDRNAEYTDEVHALLLVPKKKDLRLVSEAKVSLNRPEQATDGTRSFTTSMLIPPA